MQLSFLSTAMLGSVLAFCAASASAADYQFRGNLSYNTDRVGIRFDATGSGDVRLWTDSWSNGTNFDPISVLWKQTGNDYTRVLEVDDDDTIAAGQGFYDTGMAFSGLAAGHYLYVVGPSFVEPFANGNLLSDGYTQDGSTPIPISLWNQPSYDPNANDQKGSFYKIHLSGVDNAVMAAVPEPTSVAMMLAGLGFMGGIVRRRKRAA
jgi:hypothetical protein